MTHEFIAFTAPSLSAPDIVPVFTWLRRQWQKRSATRQLAREAAAIARLDPHLQSDIGLPGFGRHSSGDQQAILHEAIRSF